ncbi:Metalloenzyme, LuxS/M16 peptidase-like protein [Roridomyces roridus]|uniref:Cytochrome b-c1 complex subunit 2, mitochondrial n=1 Tax=Roridomyces roridus TaxID=1738132 RepID=A0AAD7BJP9_9AGAR|nr:Metalloenzyme, LuxS/M16 peptidase-like protein [Roridomyces roridus]
MLASRASVRSLARRSFATVVDNAGVKVAAVDTNQPTVSITVLAKAGSRYQQKPGVAHALKNFAFKGTEERSALGTIRESELYGGVLSSTLSREHLALTAEFLRGDEQFFVNVLASVIASTKYTRHEFQELVLPTIESEVNALHKDPATHALELAHALAFRSGLGSSLFASSHPHITAADVEQFAATAFAPGNIAFLGTGISQSALSSLVQSTIKFEGAGSSAPSSTPSTYFGGETRHEAHGVPQTLFIGFRCLWCPYSRARLPSPPTSTRPPPSSGPAARPLCSRLLGRLFQAVHLPYSDGTLVGLVIQGPTAAAVRETGKAAVAAFKASSSVKADDLKSAIAKAKFRLATTADGRAGIVDVLGSKVLAGVSETSLDASLSALDGVTADRFNKAVSAITKSKPTFVAIGDTQSLPYADELGL